MMGQDLFFNRSFYSLLFPVGEMRVTTMLQANDYDDGIDPSNPQ